MTDSENERKPLEDIARESLGAFATIAEAAKNNLASVAEGGLSVPIADNTWTSPEPDRNRRRIDQENADGYRLLSLEPPNVCVTVVDEEGSKTTSYICRAAPVSVADKRIKLASYSSSVGRLAALPVGSDHTLHRDGRADSVEVLEYARLKP